MIHWKIKHYQNIDSTQDYLIQKASDVDHGNCIYSNQQSSGKGREQRVWDSGFGGLYCSFIIKPPQLLPELPFLLLWVTLESLEKISNLSFQLKMPNDILYEQKKVSGMLIDSKIQGNRPLYYVCGVGVNVNQSSFEDPLKATAISLKQICQKEFAIDMLLKDFLTRFNDKYTLLKTGEFQTEMMRALSKRKIQISYSDDKKIKFEDYWYAKRS